jgi:hypothetical protein
MNSLRLRRLQITIALAAVASLFAVGSLPGTGVLVLAQNQLQPPPPSAERIVGAVHDADTDRPLASKGPPFDETVLALLRRDPETQKYVEVKFTNCIDKPQPQGCVDQQGVFRFTKDPGEFLILPGNYKLNVTANGYLPRQLSFEVPAGTANISLGTVALKRSPVQLVKGSLVAPSAIPPQGGIIQWEYTLKNNANTFQLVRSSSTVQYYEGVNGQIIERTVTPAGTQEGFILMPPNGSVHIVQKFDVRPADPSGLASVNLHNTLVSQRLEWDPYPELFFTNP